VLFLLVPLLADRYVTVLLTDIACFALFAVSLHFIMGPAGMVSFGHAAYFGLGAYAAALLFKRAGLPMEAALLRRPFVAGLFAVIYGWFCVRLSGVYLAMLTLAFAQISWSIVFQWDASPAAQRPVGICAPPGLAQDGLLLPDAWRLRRRHRAAVRGCSRPFGYALRAGRDSPLRARRSASTLRAPVGGFVLAGVSRACAGAVFAFSKGSIVRRLAISIAPSVDALVHGAAGGVRDR
jgi:branched-chain amino acid transport system permease protein